MKRCVLPFAILGFTISVHAAEIAVDFDPAQTRVQYTLGDVIHTVKGTFKLKHGSIHFDPATGTAGGSLVIDAASGNSASEGRDKRMKRDVLETQKFPDITFTPQHVNGHVALDGDSKVEIQGVFNLHGADHPMTMAVQVNIKNSVVKASTHFVVPYQKWGLKNPSTFVLRVSGQVDIDIQAVGHEAKS